MIVSSEGLNIHCETEQKTKGMWTERRGMHETQTENLETQQPHLLFHMCIGLRVHPNSLSHSMHEVYSIKRGST